MIKAFLAPAVAFCSIVLLSHNPTTASEHEVRAVPVNFLACDFNEGKTMADLQGAFERFDRWATRRDAPYTAWALTPRFYDNDDMFDVGWLGTWPNGDAFGVSQDAWVQHGGDVEREIGKVIDCTGRQELLTSVVVHAPNGPPANGVVLFSQCTLYDGRTLTEAYEASRELALVMSELGSTASQFMFYPGLGAADEGYDFWRVTTFNNYSELGSSAEIYINGDGWGQAQKVLGQIAHCTHPVTFDARLIRNGNTRPRDKL